MSRALGPGLITGAADDDPSSIATYSQVGAQFGYALTWMMLFMLPLMFAVQLVSGWIGWRSRGGLAKSFVQQFPRPVVHALVASFVVANVINIAADLAAMGASMRLVLGGAAVGYALGFGLACLLAEVFVPYHRYAKYLKALTVVLLAYVLAAFSQHIPWRSVAIATLIPSVSLDRTTLLAIVAMLGTTISPYLFFWQASQEAEESRLSGSSRKRGFRGRHVGAYFRHISIDTSVGMGLSNLVGFFIIVTAAVALHVHGVTRIETAAQAASALRPLAGALTFALFATGLIGTGLLGIPVLAGSAAYAVAEVLGFEGSLELPARRARGFYAILGIAIAAGVALAACGLDPIAMLFWSAVINGIAAVPIMVVMMLLVSSPRGLTCFPIPGWLRSMGWLSTGVMAVAVVLYFGSLIGSHA